MKVLDKCQSNLGRPEILSKDTWSDLPVSQRKKKWAALRIAFKKDQIAKFQRVLERTKITLILELMLSR
jgi:hypothetical protein